ncbi:MAG: galactonate dehydratase [Halobacteriaceae archaeon]
MRDVTITDVETHIVANPWKPWVFVRVHTDAGVTGLAEATLMGKAETVAAAVDEMRHHFVGESPFQTERLWLKMFRDEAYSDNVVNTTVISAVDTACWDIKGKLFDAPLYDLLGGAMHGHSLRAYANGWYTDAGGTPEGFARAAERVVDDGYTALKFDPFGTAWERMDRGAINDAVDVVAAVRESVGPDVDVLIEGHGRFTPGTAVDVARELEPYKPSWFEEPTPAESVDSLRKVAERTTIPIATGERRMSKYPFRDLLQTTDVDVVQPDIANTGGVTEVKKIASLAEAERVSVAPHNPQGPVATAVAAHVDTSVPNFTIQEVFVDYDVEWAADLLADPVTVADGRLQVPEGPGLGVELDMDAVREHEYTGENVDTINLFADDWESRATDLDER